LQAWADRTFREVLKHPSPPLGLLRLIKYFAKAQLRQSDGPIPSEVAKALYFCSIAAAQRRHGQSITKLDAGELRVELDRCLAQPWLDSTVRELLRSLASELESP
jgi:hypothetical protein